MKDVETRYDMQRRARAINTGVLRAVIAGYLVYLGVTILRDQLAQAGELPPVLGWTAGLLFAAGGAIFARFSWRRFRADLEAARLPEEQEK